ncbi:MAG: hypothetical protein NUV69_03415 [Candidatus Curtissbacteria bacterium]|nr:hypothetical protein [Candidatus Curtissbacteria bacterium]
MPGDFTEVPPVTPVEAPRPVPPPEPVPPRTGPEATGPDAAAALEQAASGAGTEQVVQELAQGTIAHVPSEGDPPQVLPPHAEPPTPPPPAPEQQIQDPAYQAMVDQAERTTNDSITARETAGENIAPELKAQIRQNNLEIAAFAYATQHPDQARALAGRDPLVKSALDKIDAQKQAVSEPIEVSDVGTPDYENVREAAEARVTARDAEIRAKETKAKEKDPENPDPRGITLEEREQIIQNELDVAAYKFVRDHPEEAQKLADSDPKIKDALNRIANTPERQEEAIGDLMEQMAELRGQLRESNKALKETQENLVKMADKMLQAIKENDPGRRSLLLAMVEEFIRGLPRAAAVSTTEVPATLKDQLADQQKAS